MVWELGSLGLCAAAGFIAYGVRGRSAQMFGASVHRGPANKRSIALTFDDGPSESTPELLDLLAAYRAPATFFQCGMNVRRLPQISRAVQQAGHEIGNHTDSHAWLPFRTAAFIEEELRRAQDSIREATGSQPRLFRAPYGARWFGLRRAQRKLRLLGVMWTTIGMDWKLPAEQVVAIVRRGFRNGAIICLHDGRNTQPNPDIRNTIEAVRRIVPEIIEQGFRFETVSGLVDVGRPE